MSIVEPRTGAQLRRAFLDYFAGHGHTEVPSSPLVPHGDPTLMFTTAGMVQFKPYYTATGDVPYTRAVSVQKCLRLTDLDNVGITPRHDTFFEMLGNFSFGPRAKGAYFKEEATAFAWEFITKVLGLPKQRLFVSIFGGEPGVPRDDEAAALWMKLGLAPDHLVALGRKDNFWGPAGGAGACGPCSEIYFDLGETRPDYLPEGAFWGETAGDAGDRFMEFWNLVFPQFDAQSDGTLNPLPNPGIDTGMGIERLALILQQKNTIFDTDLFAPMVEAVISRATTIKDRRAATRDARIIADHVRALSFAIAEGALPGNEGAGYVLRRLLRRAITRGRSKQSLGLREAFLPRVAEQVIEQFGRHYSELVKQRERVLRVLEQEEAGFGQTYESGMTRLEELLEANRSQRPTFDLNRYKKDLTAFPNPVFVTGAQAFELHDTFGFPIELTGEIVVTRGGVVDTEGFDSEMEAQRKRARAASKFAKDSGGESIPWEVIKDGPDSIFTGYVSLDEDGVQITRWRERGDETEVVLDRTPFYAESGGQVADRGTLLGGVVGEVSNVYKENDVIVHRVRLRAGTRGELLAAAAAGLLGAHVLPGLRASTRRHHTATHLLHSALRKVLGTHVHQAGSLVAPDRLRFDYAHFQAPTQEQLAEIEGRVNTWILADRNVSTQVMPIAEAKALGAMALFGEKYGAEVRLVTVDGVPAPGFEPSRELCGGTHVTHTSEIGAFKVIEESAIASGTRRIEALCGEAAIEWFNLRDAELRNIESLIQLPAAQVPAQIDKLREEVEYLKGELVRLASVELERELDGYIDAAEVSPRGRWFVAILKSPGNAETLRGAADRTAKVLGRGAFVVASQSGGKLTFMASVSADLVAQKTLSASELVKKVAQVTGGSGGGKPHLALAGGKDAGKLAEALAEAKRLLAEALA